MYWSWILAVVGLTGFILAGRKVWWAWFINVAAQLLWLAYGLVTFQYGFVFSAIIYAAVFSWNSYNWTKEHHIQTLEENAKAVAQIKEIRKHLDYLEFKDYGNEKTKEQLEKFKKHLEDET